jgi:hypothetical protein
MPKQFTNKRDRRPPLEFEINYEQLIDGEWEEKTEKFRARPSVQGHMLLQMATSMDKGIGIQAVELIKLLNEAIWPDDLVEFNTLIDDPDIAISIDTLGEILEWLAESYTDRPTQPA